jgi:hypothetical protein
MLYTTKQQEARIARKDANPKGFFSNKLTLKKCAVCDVTAAVKVWVFSSFKDTTIMALQAVVTTATAAVTALNVIPAQITALDTRITTLENAPTSAATITQLQTDVMTLQTAVTPLATVPATITTLTTNVNDNCAKIKEVTDVTGTPGTDNDAILTSILAVVSPTCA